MAGLSINMSGNTMTNNENEEPVFIKISNQVLTINGKLIDATGKTIHVDQNGNIVAEFSLNHQEK